MKDVSDRVCALEWRYGSSEMRRLFTQENIVKTMARVEEAILEGLVEAGIAPRRALEELRRAKPPSPEEVYEEEKRIGHDVASLVFLLGRRAGGEASRWIHYGATSNDVVDTAWALILREALSILKSKLSRIISILSDYAEKHSSTIMVGRTHGQHALPITLGFKLANYVYELSRSYERICCLEKRLLRAKIAGAVGTMAAWGDKGLIVRDVASRSLGLEPHVITTQVAPRDGFAELVSALAIMASQLERLALEVRELARPEIGEVWEDRGGRIGSSAMPQKANPVTAERIAGLSRLLRGLVSSAIENIVLWHERDLSNSSYERIMIPHAILVADQVLEDAISLLSRLRLDEERMRRNLELTRGAVMAEALLGLLVKAGMSREEAYRLVKELTSRMAKTGRSLLEEALSDPRITRLVSRKELEEGLDPSNYLGQAERLVSDAVEYSRRVLSSC
ncbi:MAG: adenylosuccinate lyase [Pyrodictiaceae archaeon]